MNYKNLKNIIDRAELSSMLPEGSSPWRTSLTYDLITLLFTVITKPAGDINS